MAKALPILALAAALGSILAAGGCTAPGLGAAGELGDASAGSLPPAPPGDDPGRLRDYAQVMSARYAARPDDKATAIRYAGTLRALTQFAQAVAVLQRLAVKYPHDQTVLGAYGKALADAGRLTEAADVLARAHTPEQPNWTILSAQGSVADQMGDHARAQGYYAAALKMVPDQPGVMSNLGLSYALEQRLPLAEETLRRAAGRPEADARVRQNLALVLALQGKYADAEAVSRRDLSPIEAADSVQSLRRMIARSDLWKRREVADVAPRGGHRAEAAQRRDERTRTADADGF